MAWWTKVDGKVEKHDGQRPRLSALIRINFARNLSNVPLDKMGLYKKDPEKNPDAENVLPAMLEKHQKQEWAKQVKKDMGRKSRKG